jgi:hypothetical protein
VISSAQAFLLTVTPYDGVGGEGQGGGGGQTISGFKEVNKSVFDS